MNPHMKRQRGRGRKPGGGGHHNNNFNPHQPNRAMESSGPDVKVRGPAAHIYERYLQLARDAQSSGDRVLSENYLQHADHYFRLVRQMQPATPPPQTDRYSNDDGFEGGDDDGAPEGEGAEFSAGGGGDSGEQSQPQQGQGQQQHDRGDGEFRRRRGRRSRFRPGGEDGAGVEAVDERPPREPRDERAENADRPERTGGPERTERPERVAERAERPERRERAPRERSEAEVQEGFSTGPRPAFLGGD